MNEFKEFCEGCNCYFIDKDKKSICLNFCDDPPSCVCVDCLIKMICTVSCDKFISFKDLDWNKK